MISQKLQRRPTCFPTTQHQNRSSSCEVMPAEGAMARRKSDRKSPVYVALKEGALVFPLYVTHIYCIKWLNVVYVVSWPLQSSPALASFLEVLPLWIQRCWHQGTTFCDHCQSQRTKWLSLSWCLNFNTSGVWSWCSGPLGAIGYHRHAPARAPWPWSQGHNFCGHWGVF